MTKAEKVLAQLYEASYDIAGLQDDLISVQYNEAWWDLFNTLQDALEEASIYLTDHVEYDERNRHAE